MVFVGIMGFPKVFKPGLLEGARRQNEAEGFGGTCWHCCWSTDSWLAVTPSVLGQYWQGAGCNPRYQKSVLVWSCPHPSGPGERKIQHSTVSQHRLSDSSHWEISFKHCKLEAPTIAMSIPEQKWLWKLMIAKEGLVLFTKQNWNTRGREKEQIYAENVTGAVTWALRAVPFEGFCDPTKIPALWLLLL